MRTNSNASEDHSAAPIAIEALGGDAIDQLLDRIKGDADGGNGAGNNGGDGDGSGGGGKDPYDAPATIKMLLDAAKQIAEHTAQIGRMSLKTTEALSDATIGAIHDQHDAMQATAKQLHENAMQSIAVSTRLAEATANRFDALEARIGALERALGRSKLPENGAGDDAGGGP